MPEIDVGVGRPKVTSRMPPPLPRVKVWVEDKIVEKVANGARLPIPAPKRMQGYAKG